MTPLERAAVQHVLDIRDGRAWAESFARLAKAADAAADTLPAPPDPEPVTRPAVKVCPACKRPRRQRGSCSDEFHSLASSQNLRSVTEELRSLMPKDEDPKT